MNILTGTGTAFWGTASQYHQNQGSENEEQELHEESLQSDFKLPFFKVCLFATILEDVITKLRIVDECNTELKIKKTAWDMVYLLARKHHVEESLVTNELDTIDPKKLGCEEYTLNKLKADREITIQVLKDTYQNLILSRQFKSLSDYVMEASERHKHFHFLIEDEIKNKLLCRDISRQRRQQRYHIKLVTYEKNNILKILKCSLQDAGLNSATRCRYVEAWQRSRSEQHKLTIINQEAAPSTNIEVYKTKAQHEQHVHSEVELLFNINIQEVMEKIEQWMKKYETDMEKIELKIQRIKLKHEHTAERRLELEETIINHAELIKNFVKFKEDREAARQYREKMLNSAIIIQAWWRGLLVRNQLGPYKVGKKRAPPPKEKEKSKKK